MSTTWTSTRKATPKLMHDPPSPTRTLNRLIRCGVIPARQVCKGAPRMISADALGLPDVDLALEKGVFLSAPGPEQIIFDFE